MKYGRSIIALALFSAHLCGCSNNAPLRLQLEPDVQRPPKSVVLFFVDGMDARRFNQLLADGKLPNIRRRFVELGVSVENAVTSIPAMTYPNTTALLTGRFPGHTDIVGNQWFDRSTLIRPDYITVEEYVALNDDIRCPTLYEAAKDLISANALGTCKRGVTFDIDHHLVEGVGWFLGLSDNVDELSASCLEDIGAIANAEKRWPAIMTFYFPGVDQVGHKNGSHSAAYAAAMKHVDAQIGRVMVALDRAGVGKSTYYALVTDHSHMPTNSERACDLIGWLQKNRDLHVFDGPITGADREARLATLDGYNLVVLNGSYRRMALHLRGSHDWLDPATQIEINNVLGSATNPPCIVDLPGVGLICTAVGNDQVTVMSHHGKATIERKSERETHSYRLVLPPANESSNTLPADPLEYSLQADLRSFIEMGWHTSREWLAATAATKFPDFVPQIVEYFDSPRAGDIVIFADEGWAFSWHDRGEHGSALAADMRVPMLFAGPDLAKGSRIPCARLVDVMPTLLDLLDQGKHIQEIQPIDGISIAPQLRSRNVAKVP